MKFKQSHDYVFKVGANPGIKPGTWLRVDVTMISNDNGNMREQHLGSVTDVVPDGFWLERIVGICPEITP